MATYRFFGNEEIEWEDILAPHIESSVARIAAHEVVLPCRQGEDLERRSDYPLFRGGDELHPC